MATIRAVEAALKLLALAFAGDVTAERVQLWHAALADVDDEALGTAVKLVIREYAEEYIPPVAVIREAAGANAGALDMEAVTTDVNRLGRYHPNGWVPPSVRRIREKLGDAIANAAADVGVSRLLSDDTTTREIAAREFRLALKREARLAPETIPVWLVLRPFVRKPGLIGPGGEA